MPTSNEFDTMEGFLVNGNGEFFPMGEVKSFDITTTDEDCDEEYFLNLHDGTSIQVSSIIIGKHISAKRFKKLLMSIGMKRNYAEIAVIVTRLKGIPYGDAWTGCSIMGWKGFFSWLCEYA